MIAILAVLGIVALLIMRLTIAESVASEIDADESPWSPLDGILLGLLASGAILIGLFTFYRGVIFGGLVNLRNQLPNAVIVPVVVDELGRSAIESHSQRNRLPRLPGYFLLALESGHVSLWSGKRPKLIADFSSPTLDFRLSEASTLAEKVPVVLLLPSEMVFTPLDEKKRVLPRRLEADRFASLLQELRRAIQ